MESSLKATQEQLSEQIAGTVHQEQNSRKSQTKLKTLRECIIASEEEISDYKWVTAFSVFQKQKTLKSTVNPFNMYCINHFYQVRCSVNTFYDLLNKLLNLNDWLMYALKYILHFKNECWKNTTVRGLFYFWNEKDSVVLK